MIVYRRQEGKLIYDGLNPQSKLESTQQELITNIITAAKARGTIDQDSIEIPQVSVVTDARKLRESNAGFYASARNGDILAYFLDSGVVVLYRDDAKSIINAGAHNTQIR